MAPSEKKFCSVHATCSSCSPTPGFPLLLLTALSRIEKLCYSLVGELFYLTFETNIDLTVQFSTHCNSLSLLVKIVLFLV